MRNPFQLVCCRSILWLMLWFYWPFYIYLVISQSLYAIKDPFIQFSVWESLPSCGIFPYGLTLALFILLFCHHLWDWSISLASSSKESEEALEDPDLFELNSKRKEKGQREDDAFLMKERQRIHLVLKPVKRKAAAYHCSLVWTLWFAFSKRFSFTSSKDYDLYEWNGPWWSQETCLWSGQVLSTFFTFAALSY